MNSSSGTCISCTHVYVHSHSNLTFFFVQKSIVTGENDVGWYLETILTKSIVSPNPHLRQVARSVVNDDS